MSELKGIYALEYLSQQSSADNEEPPMNAVSAVSVGLAVGDCFEKCGRRAIKWQIDAIAHPPHIGRIITLAEIDGTARIQVRASDIFDMGFSRVADFPPPARNGISEAMMRRPE